MVFFNDPAKIHGSTGLSALENSSSGSAFRPIRMPQFAGRATRSEPGGNLKTAQLIKPIPGAFKRADTVGKGDRDLFKAVLTTAAKVDISFRNKSLVPIRLSILDSQGKVLRFGGQSLKQAVGRGTFVQSLTGVLPGTYFIQLTAKANTPAKYRLRLITTSLNGAT